MEHKAIEASVQLYYIETPNNIYPNGHWTFNVDCLVDGKELGGSMASFDTLQECMDAAMESVTLSTDIMPRADYSPSRVGSWLKRMRDCLK